MHGGFASNRDRQENAGLASGRRAVTKWLSIDESEALFVTRGFASTPAQPRLESAGKAFISGYNHALAAEDTTSILRHVSSRIHGERGFVAEGAAMAAAMRTALKPWRNKLGETLSALSASYPHLAHVGVGWAIARMPFSRRWLIGQLDPRLLPLATDGQGFHNGYFHGLTRATRRRPSGEWGRIYDQGLGRSLWFICGADPEGLCRFVAAQDPDRQDDLWAGIGLACVYAGGANAAGLDTLRRRSGPSLRWLRQGAAFAISAYSRTGEIPNESAEAAALICDANAATLIRLVEWEFEKAIGGSQPRSFQNWRRGVAVSLDPQSVAGDHDEPD